MKLTDLATDVVDRLIAQIEAGAGEWKMPWSTAGLTPHNATTGVGYRGGNIVVLWVSQLAHEYRSPQWATYKQWRSNGRQVRKGQHGTHLVHWSRKETTDDEGNTYSRLVPNSFVVFNLDQTDAVDADGEHFDLREATEQTWFPEAMQTTLSLIPATIAVGMPCYIPALDRVMMPPVEAFDSTNHYMSTLAHELIHWTGHSSRLNRDLTGRFGDEAYAMEELVAELGSAFMCANYGIGAAQRLDHAPYLAHWISVLRADPTVLFTVGSLAQRAVDHLEHDYQPLEAPTHAAA